MQTLVFQLLLFGIGILARTTSSFERIHQKDADRVRDPPPSKLRARSPMPPRWAPGTPPESRRQSVDRIPASMLKELSAGEKSKSPTREPKKQNPKQDLSAAVSKISLDSTAKPRPKANPQGRRSSPSARSHSSGSDDFLRTTEMPTSKIYGPPSSSEDEASRDRRARRRKIIRRPMPSSGNQASSHHYSSAESLPTVPYGTAQYYSDSSSSGLDTSSD